MDQSKLKIEPVSLKEANLFVEQLHRHHKKVQGHKFSIAAIDETGNRVGVAIIGSPVARMLDDGYTLEVTRLCTDGTPNACSILYAAARRAAKDLGYKKIVTYILENEPGTSLKASGWICIGECGGGSWSRENRIREDKHPICRKLRWEANVGA